MAVSLQELLALMVEKGASDLHIAAGTPPQLRINGILIPQSEILTPVDTKEMCYSVMTDRQKHLFEERNELDFSFGLRGLARFRANVFMQRGAVGGAFRRIPSKIMTYEELGIPPVVQELARRPRGLILVTGPTGCGKSTTLATIVDQINTERHCHIMTIEDPIEYIHSHKNSLVNQREVGSDTHSFHNALRSVLRQDPDVILIGEMRDLETIETALTAAETGHLVLATLHTNSAVQTINRIIDVFPPHQQSQVRAQLSFVLEGVMTQMLLPRSDGHGRCLAVEIMIPNPAIRNLIREDKIHQIYSQMQIGQAKFGMQTMNQSLLALYQKRLLALDQILAVSPDPDELRNMIRGISPAQARG